MVELKVFAVETCEGSHHTTVLKVRCSVLCPSLCMA